MALVQRCKVFDQAARLQNLTVVRSSVSGGQVAKSGLQFGQERRRAVLDPVGEAQGAFLGQEGVQVALGAFIAAR